MTAISTWSAGVASEPIVQVGRQVTVDWFSAADPSGQTVLAANRSVAAGWASLRTGRLRPAAASTSG